MASTGPVPYLLLPGTAQEALETYARVFGGELQLHTFGDFGRTDGPAERIAHGVLTGTVRLFAADTGEEEASFAAQGLLLSLLGIAEPSVLREWFDALSAGGTVLDPLAERPWGDWDGQVRDRFGLVWLIGWEGSSD